MLKNERRPERDDVLKNAEACAWPDASAEKADVPEVQDAASRRLRLGHSQWSEVPSGFLSGLCCLVSSQAAPDGQKGRGWDGWEKNYGFWTAHLGRSAACR
jgi:hypothetical protein